MTTSHKSAGGGTSSANAVQTGSESKHVPIAGACPSASPFPSTHPRREPRLVVKRGPLSFQTTTSTVRGRYVSSSDFDVPAETCEAGWVTGRLAADELLRALKAGTICSVRAERIIATAGAQMSVSLRGADQSPRFAAHMFIRGLAEMIEFGAKYSNHEQLLPGKLERDRLDRERLAAYRASERREAGARMKAGKLAKKAAVQLLARLQENGHA